MKFKSIATPEPSIGLVTPEKKAVVPNMSLSLEEILRRFTRGEPLLIGRGEPQYDEGPDDLEKVANMDLVDKEEYIDKLKATQKTYDKQEARKKGEEKTRLEQVAIDKIVADKKAEKAVGKTAKKTAE